MPGGVVTSSSGFAVEKVRMPDYEEALVADTGRARYVGHITEDGEKCMAVTRIIYSGDGEPMGAVRVISSLEMIDRQIGTIVLLIFLALVLIFAVILYSNLFFIRSIIIPVQEINQTTKKISQGTTPFVLRRNIMMKSAIWRTPSTKWLRIFPLRIK